MKISAFALCLALTGCASVSINQLEPKTLTLKPGAPEGAVYYLPKPYLFVAQVPVASTPPREELAQPVKMTPPKTARSSQAIASPPLPNAGYGTVGGAGKDDSGDSDAAAATGAFGIRLGQRG
jgi:hypothetical protein